MVWKMLAALIRLARCPEIDLRCVIALNLRPQGRVVSVLFFQPCPLFSHIVFFPRIRFLLHLDEPRDRLRHGGKIQIEPSALQDDSKHWIPPFLAGAGRETRNYAHHAPANREARYERQV